MNHYLYYDLSKIFIGSQNAGLLVTPIISKNRLGSRAFSYWAPLLWNQLSPWVREADPLPPHLSHLVVWPWRLAVSLCFHIFSTAPPPVWTNCNFSPWFSWEFLLSRCEGLREEDVVMMLMLCKALWDKLFVKTGYKNKIALPCLTRLDCNSYSCY